jgi:hypothetical protein
LSQKTKDKIKLRVSKIENDLEEKKIILEEKNIEIVELKKALVS